MKPRTKLEHEVWELYKKNLYPIEQEPFIIKQHDFYGTFHYKSIICLECNHQFKSNNSIDKKNPVTVCPNCNKKLKIITTQNGGLAHRIITYSVIDVVERFQVVRYFSCWKIMSKYDLPRYSFYNLFEEWKDWNKNKRVIIGRTQSWSGDGFSSAEYEIRSSSNSGWGGNPYDKFIADYNCPGAKVLPRFKKYGLTKYNHHCDFRKILNEIEIEKNSIIETLLKAKQNHLLFFALNSGRYTMNQRWPQIKIAIRNKYKITDVSTWFDYLDLLEYFKKDLRNPFYILPKKLKKEHDKYVSKKNKILERKEIEREIKRQENERLKAEAEEALKGIKIEIFKDFSFKRGNINIVCLVKDEDVKKEGEILKHCVYTNDYHKKPGILLMSARIDNKPIETIEISLATYSIIQSRGLKNEATQYHDEIIDIVKSNIGKISKIVEKQKKFKELDSNLSQLQNVA